MDSSTVTEALARRRVPSEREARAAVLKPAGRPARHPMEAARAEAAEQVLELIGDMDRAFTRLTTMLARLLDVPMAVFSIALENRHVMRAAHGLDLRECGREGTFCGITVAGDDLFVIEDAQRDPDFRLNPLVVGEPHLRFYAGVPIHSPSGMPIGTLSAMAPHPRGLDAAGRQSLCDVASLVEELVLLRSMAVSDPLSGLYNRRYFEELLAREWRRSFRHLQPISLLVVDIDYFKTFNDVYGHAIGDERLRDVSQMLKRQFRRPGDVVGRYGGEEFIVVLPDTPAEAAIQLARQTCREIEEAAISHPESPYETLTVSIGVATADSRDDLQRGPHVLTGHADRALYEAKRRGRNRAVFDPSHALRRTASSSI